MSDESNRSATSDEIAEWDEEHDEPHPVFEVPNKPERQAVNDRTVDCAGAECGEKIDPLTDTHYRVDEEQRPVKSLEKKEQELEYDDFFSRGWFLCSSCMSELIEL